MASMKSKRVAVHTETFRGRTVTVFQVGPKTAPMFEVRRPFSRENVTPNSLHARFGVLCCPRRQNLTAAVRMAKKAARQKVA